MVTCEQMRAAEAAYVEKGGSLDELTRQVGREIARALIQHFPGPAKVVAYLGKGNNATDALIALKHLQASGWSIGVRCGFDASEWSELAQETYQSLKLNATAEPEFEIKKVILLDALIGIGGSGALRPPLAELADEMNQLRASGRVEVVAIDLPSGVDADTGEVHPGAVTADLTLSVGAMKVGLVQESAINSVGRLAELQMPGLSCPLHADFELLTAKRIADRLPVFEFDTHKGMAGRVGVLVGHSGMRGAANLSARAALAGGAGLVTLFCLRKDLMVMESTKPDEVMVKAVKDWTEISDADLDALVIGPGLGELDQAEESALWQLISKTSAKLVLDAGLMGMIGNSERRSEIPASAVLTPHPGEFCKLAPDLADLPRFEQVAAFTSRSPACLVLKGARTLVGQNGEKIAINSTGTSGMATPGQGDCLAGLIAAFLGSGVPSYAAATLAVWLAGRAAERAIITQSPRSLNTSQTIAELGAAMDDLRCRVF